MQEMEEMDHSTASMIEEIQKRLSLYNANSTKVIHYE